MNGYHISASSLKDFLWCPRRVYYRRNFSDSAVTTDEQGVGLAVHKVTEDKWEKQDTEYNNKIKISYNLDDYGKKKFTRCISNFYSQYSQLLTIDDLKEYYFKVPLYKNVLLVGKIDRIVVSQDLVIDWKTSEYVPKEIDHDPQFIIYYLAYKELYGKEPKVLLVNLAKNKVVEFEPKKHYIDTIRNEVIPYMVRVMEMGNYPRLGLFNKACESCSYIDTCWKEII